jgi:glycosyltransferase involved in cell wall biosynthesis
VGIRDTVIEGETGLLVPPKNVDELARALKVLLTDAELCKQMGEKARERAHREFSSERVNQAVLDEYVRLRQSPIGSFL